MSAPLAGKFQDHYAVLGIEPKSDSDTVQSAYAKLAQKYNPNSPTADAEKFAAANMAYEILADPELRREFDKLKGVGQEEGPPKFSGLAFFDSLGRDSVLRGALLCVLYDRRRTKPFTPSLSMRNLENTLEVTTEELGAALWYLKQRGLVSSDDKSSLQITVDGMDFLANNKPSPDAVMEFIKPAAIAAVTAQPAKPAMIAGENSSIQNVLKRALTQV